MLYVVTKNGKKLPVDDSAIDYANDSIDYHQPVGLFTDNDYLKPVWILELDRNTRRFNPAMAREPDWLEFVADVAFDHEPTQEEILWAMAAHGLRIGDFAFVRKGFRYEVDYND